jgi:K+-sensing histidine kinase KdpD
LNAVIGFSDVMSAELLGPVGHPRYREYAGDIRDCGRQLLKATEDTLAMTALLAAPHLRGPGQPIGLASITSEAWGFCNSEARARDIMLIMDCDQSIEALGELRPMRQVMVNLFTEAIARAPDGGTIRMSAVGDGDTIRIEVIAEEAVAPQQAVAGSLAMSLARALLELQGAGLLEITGAGPAWRAVTVVDRANQRDFFPAIETPAWQPSPALC